MNRGWAEEEGAGRRGEGRDRGIGQASRSREGVQHNKDGCHDGDSRKIAVEMRAAVGRV